MVLKDKVYSGCTAFIRLMADGWKNKKIGSSKRSSGSFKSESLFRVLLRFPVRTWETVLVTFRLSLVTSTYSRFTLWRECFPIEGISEENKASAKRVPGADSCRSPTQLQGAHFSRMTMKSCWRGCARATYKRVHSFSPRIGPSVVVTVMLLQRKRLQRNSSGCSCCCFRKDISPQLSQRTTTRQIRC